MSPPKLPISSRMMMKLGSDVPQISLFKLVHNVMTSSFPDAMTSLSFERVPTAKNYIRTTKLTT